MFDMNSNQYKKYIYARHQNKMKGERLAGRYCVKKNFKTKHWEIFVKQ